MAKKNTPADTRNLFKRDRRRAYDNKVTLPFTIEEIMALPDEYIQSMFAAYKDEPKQLTVIDSNARGQYNKDIYVRSIPGDGSQFDMFETMSTSIKWSICEDKGIQFILDNEELVKNLYGLTVDELKFMQHELHSNYTLRSLITLQARRWSGQPNVSMNTEMEFFKAHLGKDLDFWTKICSGGKHSKLAEVKRVVPPSEEFGTPALYLCSRNWN